MLFNSMKKELEYNGVGFDVLGISLEHRQMFDSFLHGLKLFDDEVMYDQSYWVTLNSMTRTKVTTVLYKVVNNCLCLFMLNKGQDNLKLMVEPIGKKVDKEKAFGEVFEILKHCNEHSTKNFSLVREMRASNIGVVPDCYKPLKLTTKDMIYDTKANIDMNGSAYKTPRRKINKLINACDALELFEYDKSVMLDDVLHIYKKWTEARAEAYEHFWDINTVKLYFENPEMFGLKLSVLYQRDIPIAYCTVGKLCSDAMMMNQRKALPEYEGACEYIWRYGLQDYYENVENLKYENDGGFDYKGLYSFKQRYNPISEIDYIEVTRKG